MKQKIQNFSKKILLFMAILAASILTSLAVIGTDDDPYDKFIAEGNIGNQMRLSYDHLTTKELYCVEYLDQMDDSNENNETGKKGRIYTIKGKISITGQQAIITANNFTQNITSYNNAKLAYILAGGEDSTYGYGYGRNQNNHSTRQEALWHFWNVWCNMKDNYFKDWNKETNEQWTSNGTKLRETLLNDADNYAGKNVVEPKINSNVTSPVMEKNNLAGPFNITYNGTLHITVKDNKGTDITKNVKLADREGNEINTQLKNGIKSAENFYIKNNTENPLGSIECYCSTSGEIISAEILCLESISAWQRLIAVKSDKKEIDKKSDTITIKTYVPGSSELIVEKKDENENLQSDVGFIISDLNGNYLTAPEGTTLNSMDMFYSDGWSLTETDKDKATVFYTGENGQFRIYNLPDSNTSYYYNISEVYNHYKDSEGNYTNKYIDYDLISYTETIYNKQMEFNVRKLTKKIDYTKADDIKNYINDNIEKYSKEKKYMQSAKGIYIQSRNKNNSNFY